MAKANESPVIVTKESKSQKINGLAAEIILCLAEHCHVIDRLAAEEGSLEIFYNRDNITLSIKGLYRGHKRRRG